MPNVVEDDGGHVVEESQSVVCACGFGLNFSLHAVSRLYAPPAPVLLRDEDGQLKTLGCLLRSRNRGRRLSASSFSGAPQLGACRG